MIYLEWLKKKCKLNFREGSIHICQHRTYLVIEIPQELNLSPDEFQWVLVRCAITPSIYGLLWIEDGAIKEQLEGPLLYLVKPTHAAGRPVDRPLVWRFDK